MLIAHCSQAESLANSAGQLDYAGVSLCPGTVGTSEAGAAATRGRALYIGATGAWGGKPGGDGGGSCTSIRTGFTSLAG